jgi:hypothetical protein
MTYAPVVAKGFQQTIAFTQAPCVQQVKDMTCGKCFASGVCNQMFQHLPSVQKSFLHPCGRHLCGVAAVRRRVCGDICMQTCLCPQGMHVKVLLSIRAFVIRTFRVVCNTITNNLMC